MCAQIMGSFSSFSRTLLYSCGTQDHWSRWFIWYLLIACFNWYLLIACVSLCYVFVAYLSVAIFGHQYSLSSSKYWQSDMCIAFHSLVEKYTIYGGPQFILAFLDFLPILAIDANGGEVSESFVEKFRELSLLALVLFLSICISFACTIGCCIAW